MTAHANRGGSPRSNRITETDHEVLLKIAKLGFQSYPELRAGPLKDSSRCHSWVAESPALLERLYQKVEADQVTLEPENERRVIQLESELKELEKKSRNLIESVQTLSEGYAREALTQQLEVLAAQVKAKMAEVETLKAEADNSEDNVEEPILFKMVGAQTQYMNRKSPRATFLFSLTIFYQSRLKTLAF